MGTYKKYIDDLEIQKNNLVTALNVKGVEANENETFNTLVPKVEEITTSKPEQEKTVSITSSGSTIITPDSGKVLSKVTASVGDGTLTNNISVSNSGLITVNSQITGGYMATNAKRTTKQLSTQSVKTITPTTTNQTAVSAYKFTTGAITVAGDVNLTAANIKAGTKIFGVTGTHASQKIEQTKTVDLSMASGNQTVTPDSGKVLNKVIVNKPSTLIPANIKKDVNIGGIVGTLESGGGSPSTGETTTVNVNLTYNEEIYIKDGTVIAIWETTEGIKCSDAYDISLNFTLSGVLINSKVFLVYHIAPGNNYYIKKINSSGITGISVPNIDDNDSYCPVYAFEVLNSSASITVFLGRYSG